jgi:hypothetical protein
VGASQHLLCSRKSENQFYFHLESLSVRSSFIKDINCLKWKVLFSSGFTL